MALRGTRRRGQSMKGRQKARWGVWPKAKTGTSGAPACRGGSGAHTQSSAAAVDERRWAGAQVAAHCCASMGCQVWGRLVATPRLQPHLHGQPHKAGAPLEEHHLLVGVWERQRWRGRQRCCWNSAGGKLPGTWKVLRMRAGGRSGQRPPASAARKQRNQPRGSPPYLGSCRSTPAPRRGTHTRCAPRPGRAPAPAPGQERNGVVLSATVPHQQGSVSAGGCQQRHAAQKLASREAGRHPSHHARWRISGVMKMVEVEATTVRVSAGGMSGWAACSQNTQPPKGSTECGS